MAGVDVVIPSYNYGRYLRACAESVLSQQLRDLRLLIIDNASTDDSAEVARDIAAHDPRVELLLRSRNLGPHASFNEGIDWARADFFLILCADDMLAPGALARACSIMQTHANVHLTFGGSVAISADTLSPFLGVSEQAFRGWSIIPGRALLEQFCRNGRNHLFGPSCVVRTAVQKAVGHCRPALPHTDDFEMWMRFTCHGDAAETDAIQAFNRMHAGNQSATVRDLPRWDAEYLAAFESFFANEGARLPDGRDLLRLARVSLGERAYWSALSCLSRGEVRTAGALARFAFRMRPASVLVPPLNYLRRRPDALARIAAGLGLARLH